MVMFLFMSIKNKKWCKQPRYPKRDLIKSTGQRDIPDIHPLATRGVFLSFLENKLVPREDIFTRV